MTEFGDLETVVAAIAVFGAQRSGTVYVERLGSRYRWSIAHRGGAYPLLREVAAFLGVPYHSLAVPFRTVQGWTVVRPEPNPGKRVGGGAFVEAATESSTVRKRIEAALPLAPTE